MSCLWEVQKAIYTALSGDSTFMALVFNRLYDEPDTNEEYPYVIIGNCVENKRNILNGIGYEVYMDIRIYTKPFGLGYYEAKTILNRMNTILNFKKFSMTGFTMVNCQYENSYTDKENELRIISARYKILV